MKNWSIDNKLWLGVLSPCAFCCGVLTLVFMTWYFTELDRTFESRSLMIGKDLSQSVESLLAGSPLNQTGELQALFERQLAGHSELKSIVLLNENQQPIVQRGPVFPIKDFATDRTLTQSPLITHARGEQSSLFKIALGNSSLWLNIEIDRSALQLQKFQVAMVLALVAGVVLLLAIVVFALLKHLIAKPLADLRENMERLSYGEIEKVEVNHYGQPFDLLFNYVRRTSELIKQSRKELQETVEQTTSDLRESLETVEEQNIELNLARKQALAASKAKTEFLSNTSHEIRTPINGILGFVHLLLKSELTEQQRDYLQNIEKSSQGLLTAINSILDVAKIETGQLVLDYNPFDLEEVVKDSVEIFTASAKQKSLRLQWSIDHTLPQDLLGDPLRLKQILCNLIGNAIKFSSQGDITVKVSPTEPQPQKNDDKVELLFTVQDQGKGIDPDLQHNLFQIFSQLDSSDSREQGGTGLGLAVSKGLVELMHGKIGVDSAVGQGATFWFRVRFAVNESARSATTVNVAQTSRPSFRADILTVDDTPANLQLLNELLKDLGATVHPANNGMEALGLCEQRDFDLIFMDIQMPVIDGLETARRIRRMEKPPRRAPIVALTAHAMTDQKTDLLLAGMDDYLTKPVSENQLTHVLKRWLKKHEVFETDSDVAAQPRSCVQEQTETAPPINYVAAPVDIQLSLKLSNNKPDLARDMLSALLNELPAQKAKIHLAQKGGDLNTLEEVVHKIRGGASYCGVVKLKSSSSNADELLRKKSYDEASIVTLLGDIEELLTWSNEVDIDALFGLETVH